MHNGAFQSQVILKRHFLKSPFRTGRPLFTSDKRIKFCHSLCETGLPSKITVVAAMQQSTFSCTYTELKLAIQLARYFLVCEQMNGNFSWLFMCYNLNV